MNGHKQHTLGVAASHWPHTGPSSCRNTSSGLPLLLQGESDNCFIIYHRVIIIEIKHTTNEVRLNHSETSPPPSPAISLKKKCLPRNQSLVPSNVEDRGVRQFPPFHRVSLTMSGSRSQKGAEPEVSLSRACIADPKLHNTPLRREVMGREGLTAGHHTESHQMRHIFPPSPHFQLCLKEPLHTLRALISNSKERACLSQPGEVH